MKRIKLMLTVGISIFFLIGCSDSIITEEEKLTEDYLTTVAHDYIGESEVYIVYENETGVMYLAVQLYDNSTDLTILYSPDGTPLTYDEWLGIEE